MITPFESADSGYRSCVDKGWMHLLNRLIEEILIVLDPPDETVRMLRATTGFEMRRHVPDDPTLDALLPPMSKNKDEAEHMRAVSEDFLRSEKALRLQKIQKSFPHFEHSKICEIFVCDADVWEWLAALNDLRLALAGEMGEIQDSPGNINDCAIARAGHISDDPSSQRVPTMLLMFDLLTWWQDSLLRAMHSGR